MFQEEITMNITATNNTQYTSQTNESYKPEKSMQLYIS